MAQVQLVLRASIFGFLIAFGVRELIPLAAKNETFAYSTPAIKPFISYRATYRISRDPEVEFTILREAFLEIVSSNRS